MNGYDIDGVLLKHDGTEPVVPEEPFIIISGRTWAEYDGICKSMAQSAAVYIRGTGKFDDREGASRFKVAMIKYLGVTTYHEDDPVQAQIIRENCPHIVVVEYPYTPPEVV